MAKARGGKATRGASVRINKAHFPVTVLGPGRRLGVWFQGCTIHCPDCVSRDTWDPQAVSPMGVDQLLAWCQAVVARQGGLLDGVTLSGGEPFDQPEALLALLQGFGRWRQRTGQDFDILCYSGYPLATLQARFAAHLALLDGVIPEPFVGTLPLGDLWRGSANQPLVPLSARGEARYGAYVHQAVGPEHKAMQVLVEAGRVWLIGIPHRDDMARLEALCRERGLNLEQVSWRR